MREVKLSNSGQVALIDDDDFAEVSRYTWRLEHDYAVSGKNSLPMSYVVMGEPPPGLLWDHKDRCRLHNWKENFRLATKALNVVNSGIRSNNVSGLRGVRMATHNLKNPWASQVTKDGKVKHLGYFATKEQAALAYNRAAKRLFGEFAYQNPVSEPLASSV